MTLTLPDPPDLPDPILSSGELTPAQLSANEVSENEIRRNNEGIVFENSFGYGVVDNTVSNNSDDGIVLESSTSVGVTENTVDESGRHGIWLVGGSNFNDLNENVAEDNDRAGIYLGVIGGLNPANNNTLVNNTARGNEYGIRLNNAFDNDVSESLIENNVEGISVEEELLSPLSEGIETESVGQLGNTFTEDVSRNNDWDFVIDSLDTAPISTSAASSDFPVTNLSIGASTSPDTTVSFDADDVRLRAVDAPESDPDDLENIGRYFEAEELSVDAYLNVSLSYEDGDVSGVNESTLELLRFDNGPSEWLPVGSSVDTTNNLVGVNITTFSDFGAFGEAEDDGGTSPDNPFFDASDNPISRSTVITRVVEWNLNGSINGTAYTRSEIIGFIVEWNLES